MKGDPRDAWVRSFAIAFAALGGTNFRGADLTGANFSSARLKSTNMREATLTRVRWYGADMIDRIRPGDTYLQSTQVRLWLIGKGVDNNFDGQKLQGVNFQGADLTNASFIDANLNEADLQSADLSRAKLVQTQLDNTYLTGADLTNASFIDANLNEADLQSTDLSGAKLVRTQLSNTNLTGATLTGACIEDWGITSNTILDKVKCQYVFMRLPTDNNLEPFRKPDNRQEVFEDGDFADFIKPIFDTLDLYHNQGVDPRAIAIAWKKLVENNPDANLQFSSLEVKGQGNLLLRFITAMGADLSQLNSEYFNLYNRLKTLTENEVEKLIN